MIEFDFKGIRIEAEVEITQKDYRDAGGHHKSRFDREISVVVRFWEFTIGGNLTELAFVKSTLNYFMQAYWKRSSKDGGKIDLAKVLHHDSPYEGKQSLCFMARQKDNKRYLHICLKQPYMKDNECYLDGQEVIMLDIAIAKAIGLLTPAVSSYTSDVMG